MRSLVESIKKLKESNFWAKCFLKLKKKSICSWESKKLLSKKENNLKSDSFLIKNYKSLFIYADSV